MTEDYVEQRRRYVQEIRGSFDEKGGTRADKNRLQTEWEREEEQEMVGNSVFWKVKIIFSIMLFVAFIFCDRTETQFLSLPTSKIVEMLEQTTDTKSIEGMFQQVQAASAKFSLDNEK